MPPAHARDLMRLRKNWLVLGLLGWPAGCALLFHAVPGMRQPNDFGNAFYLAAKAAWSGHLLYQGGGLLSGFVYPPPAVLLFAPFGLMPFREAQWAWYGFEFACAIGLAGILGASLARQGSRLAAGGIFMLAVASFAPVQQALWWGQPDLVTTMLTATVLAVVRDRSQLTAQRTRWVAAGVLSALAAAIKIYPIAVLLWGLIRRSWTFVVTGLITLALSLVVATGVFGVSGLGEFWRRITGAAGPNAMAVPYNFGLLGLGYRALTTNPYSTPLAHLNPATVKLIYLLVVLAAVGAGIGLLLPSRTWSMQHMALAGVAVLCLSPYLENQHLTLLLALLPSVAIWQAQQLRQQDCSELTVFWLGAMQVGVPTALSLLSFWASPTVQTRSTAGLIIGAAMAGAWLLHRRLLPLPHLMALLAASTGFLVLAAPRLLNLTTWWGVPIDPLHVLVGEARLYALLLLGLSLTVMVWLERPGSHLTAERRAP